MRPFVVSATAKTNAIGQVFYAFTSMQGHSLRIKARKGAFVGLEGVYADSAEEAIALAKRFAARLPLENQRVVKALGTGFVII